MASTRRLPLLAAALRLRVLRPVNRHFAPVTCSTGTHARSKPHFRRTSSSPPRSILSAAGEMTAAAGRVGARGMVPGFGNQSWESQRTIPPGLRQVSARATRTLIPPGNARLVLPETAFRAPRATLTAIVWCRRLAPTLANTRYLFMANGRTHFPFPAFAMERRGNWMCDFTSASSTAQELSHNLMRPAGRVDNSSPAWVRGDLVVAAAHELDETKTVAEGIAEHGDTAPGGLAHGVLQPGAMGQGACER